MSLTNMKTLMTALLLFLVIVQCNTAPAQVRSMRLWAPVRSDQFGGNSRLREGPWGEVSYNYWLITKGKNRTIGWVSPVGDQHTYFNGVSFQSRVNNMSTSALGNDFHGGTTIRIGNQVKHHGWELKTTILQAQRDSYEGIGGSMDIADDAVISITPLTSQDIWYNDGSTTYFQDITKMSGGTTSGFLWGWFLIGPQAAGYTDEFPNGDDYAYGIAPLPITFDRFKIDSKVSHWDVEANYIFRTHATRAGFFEFTGGVRYMQLDDNLNFTGWGLPWKGNVLIEIVDPTPAYGGSGGGTGGTDDDTDVTEFYLRQGVLPGTNRDYAYSGDMNGPGTVLADSKWHFKAENHIVGPQIGLRYIKKGSGRWSIIADTKFFAGFNTQNLKSEGVMGSRTAGYDPNTLTANGGSLNDVNLGGGKMPWVPVGLMQNGKEFRHSKTNTEFSPVIDFGLKAQYQITDAIAFDVGYQGMWLDKTARASLVNDYKIDLNGNIFGINDDVNQKTWMHGVSVGLKINRF